MAQYRVESVRAQSNGDVHCDTFVLNDADQVIGHFTVVLDAGAVLALAALPKGQRVAGYKLLFFSDERIQSTKESEAAAAQMNADVTFPVTVDF